MKGVKLLLIMSFLAALPDLAFAANHYVRAGATGKNDGSDWTNAYQSLPAKLTRGDTYYIADGVYNSYRFNDTESGTAYIHIKKATINDHGTNIGWNDSYGNGQAVFIASGEAYDAILYFVTGYYEINGYSGSWDWDSGHGIKLDNTNGGLKSQSLRIGEYGVDDPDNIIIKYVEIHGGGVDAGDDPDLDLNDDGLYIVENCDNITIQYCFVHDIGRDLVLIRGVNNFLLEYCLLRRNDSSASVHGQGLSDAGSNHVTIRYNRFEDIEGTGFIVQLGYPFTASDWKIYGNIFYYTDTNPSNRFGMGNGSIQAFGDVRVVDWSIYNNTFSRINNDVVGSGVQIFGGASGNNIQVRNNLWYNCTNGSNEGSGMTASHNYYFNTTSIDGEPNKQTGNTNPFVNLADENFRLRFATDPGFSLGSPYNLDPDGTLRGADGTWDRGAFEFSVGDTIPPLPPKNLRIIR